MQVERVEQRVSRARALPVRARATDRTGGTEGNQRLTGASAAVLLVLLAVEGVTIVSLRSLLSLHVFVGMMLVPPVALKLGSTGYRFARYYARNPAYRRKGPPHPLMRLLAPLVVLSTVVLLGSGVALLVVGPGGGVVLGLHKASFVLWFVLMSIHVLAYVRRVPRLAFADWRRAERERREIAGARARHGLVAAALLAGLALAAATLPLAEPWIRWVAAGFGGGG